MVDTQTFEICFARKAAVLFASRESESANSFYETLVSYTTLDPPVAYRAKQERFRATLRLLLLVWNGRAGSDCGRARFPSYTGAAGSL